MAETVKCRRATLEDKMAVVNIINAYGGRDYMPAYYNHMIEDPKFIGVLGELHGHVVAFAGAYIINRGTTMMTKGSRVKEDLQGQGIYRGVWGYLRDTAREQYPMLECEEFTSNTVNPMLYLPPEKKKYTELYRTPMAAYCVPRENYEARPPFNSSCLKEIGFQELRHILENKTLAAILFPRRIVIDWAVYLPVVENVDIMERQGTYMTITLTFDHDTKNCTSEQDSVPSDLDETSDLQSRSQLIAFGSRFPTNDHLAYTIDFYGRSKNQTHIIEHLKKHATRAMLLYEGKIHFLIVANPELLSAINQACKSLGLLPEQFFSTHCVILTRGI